MKKKIEIKQSMRTGIGFGLTSGVITTLGLISGLDAGTGSQAAILGGILTIAFADAFSDALGIHVSQESDGKNTQGNVWESTLSTFIVKLVIALTFAIPVFFLDLPTAMIACVVWGGVILSAFSYYIAERNGESKVHVIFEHLSIAIVVVIITRIIGGFVANLF